MRITIDSGDRRPIYQQVVDEIKALIAAGTLTEGFLLPPVRQLAADLGVNLNTIATSYRELQTEGLITVKHGSGAVVSSRKSHHSTPESLRRNLRTALTPMVLAGMRRAEILGEVEEELKLLMKGAK